MLIYLITTRRWNRGEIPTKMTQFALKSKQDSASSIKVKKCCLKFEPVTIKMDRKLTTLTPDLLIIKDNIKPNKGIKKSNIVNNFKTSLGNLKKPIITTVPRFTVSNIINKQHEIIDFIEDELIELDDNISDSDSDNLHNESSMLNKSTSSYTDDNSVRFYSIRNKVICVMEPDCKFSFYGKLKIKVLYGAVTIYGATLDQSNTTIAREVYSPRSTSFVEIQSTRHNNAQNNSNQKSYIWQSLKEDIDIDGSSILKTDINNIQSDSCVLILQNISNILTTFLQEHFPHKLFPCILDCSNYSYTDRKRAEIILQAHIYPDHADKKAINMNIFENVTKNILHSWEVNKNMKALIAGGKNVGKSTSMRYLVNRFLEKCNQVIIIDLDPGQSEFTPSGCISFNIIKSFLLGPNFTHLLQPYHEIYIGGTDVTCCLTNYIVAVHKLVDCLNEFLTDKKLPVIVNTMGYCKNIGWDIMCHIIKCIKPTDVIQIKSTILKNNFDQLLSNDIVNTQSNIWTTFEVVDSLAEYKLHDIDSEMETKSKVGETWNIEPHQQRDIAMLAYLSQIIKLKKVSKSWKDKRTPSSINAIIPYEVSFSSIKLSLGFSVVPYLLSVMNGNIIALCGADVSDTCNTQRQGSEVESHYPEVLAKAPLTTCYGFGIIRGVDMERKMIYINTPLSATTLKYVNCLFGCMPVPSGLLKTKRSGGSYTRGEFNLPTSRYPRRGSFRMRFNKDVSLS